MAKLYEISESFKNLEDLLADDTIPVDIIENALNEVEEEFNNKAETIAKLVRSLSLDVDMLKEEEKRIAQRRKSLENKIDYLKNYLQNQMEFIGTDKIKSPLFTISIQKNKPSVVVNDEMAIPLDFLVSKVTVDKVALFNHIKETGEMFDGVEIRESKSIRIR